MPNLKTILIRSVIRVLNPVINLLLRFEVTHREFNELSKRAYVNVAYKHYGIKNRIQTNSRVSVITGISRKEVLRLSKIIDNETLVTEGPLNRARRVIGGWLSDKDFLDSNNLPRALALKDGECNFDELVVRYSGGVTPRAILDELIRVAAVEKNSDSTVELTHHGYVPQEGNGEMMDILFRQVTDQLETSLFNITHSDTPRFQRQVTYTEMPDYVAQEFQKISREKSSALLVELNQWLADKEKDITIEKGEKTSRIGVGIYYFKNDDQDENNIYSK